MQFIVMLIALKLLKGNLKMKVCLTVVHTPTGFTERLSLDYPGLFKPSELQDYIDFFHKQVRTFDPDLRITEFIIN